MYNFSIGDKNFTLGKTRISDLSLLALEDQSISKSLDGITISSYELEEPKKVLVRNNLLNHWSYNETPGKISFHVAVTSTSDADKLAKINKLKNMLADEVVLQIADLTSNKYYKGSLLFGTVDETLDPSSFNFVYGFKTDDVGVGIYPLAPSNIRIVAKQKEVTVSFKKGGNALSTKVICGGSEISTEGESVTLSLADYSTTYSVELYSISSSGLVGTATTKSVTTGDATIIPTIPTNVTVKSIVGKSVTLTFARGTNASKTEIVLGDITAETYNEEVTILASAFSTTYDLKLRSISSNGGTSAYTDVIQVTTLAEIVPVVPVISTVTIEEDVVTFNFTEGANAVSTEFIVDGITYTTQETYLVVDIGAYSKTFTYKARSISATGTYSDYTTEANATTDVEPIIPTQPTGIVLSIVDKTVTFTFVKGTNAILTEFIVDGAAYSTEGTTLVVEIDAYSKPFAYKLRSKSSTGHYSEYTEVANATTNVEPIIPVAPTDITVSIVEKVATFTFVKGTNATSTEFVVDGTAHNTDGTTLVVDIGAYSKTFAYKARSISATGHYSDYTTEATATTGTRAPIIPTVPTSISVAFNLTVATFTFVKGTNATSTEFVVDGTTHTVTGTTTTLVVDIGSYAKTFNYKARSVSETGTYSDYTTEATATTPNQVFENVLLFQPTIKNNCNLENQFNYSPKNYVNGARIEIDGLVAMNANRYSVGASVINGTLVER